MKTDRISFENQYSACLSEFLNGEEEAALACAYEIGRLANVQDVSMLELLAAHQSAVERAIQTSKTPGEILDVTRSASRMLAESLASFEMTNRGFKESLAQLVDTNKALEREIRERKKAEEGLGKSVERLKILSEANSLLLASEDPEKVVQTIATKTMVHLNCDCFFNFIADEEADKLRLNAYAGIPAETAEGIKWLEYGVAICGCAARDGCRIISENIQENGDARAALVRSFGVQAYACHPLTVGPKTIGTLSFGTRTRTRFAEDEIEMMRTIAGQVSVAMQRKRAEEALRESEKEYRSLAENIPDIVTRYDKDLRHIFVNAAASQAAGIPAEAFIGKTNLELGMDPVQVEFWMKHVRKVFATGKPETMEFEWQAPDGLRYQQTIITPELDSEGSVRTVLCVTHNLSEIRRAEEGLKKYAHELETANKELETFSYSVSHDLRAPLRALNGFSEVILEEYGDKLGEGGKDYLFQIRKASLTMAELIDAILTLSRVSRAEMHQEKVDLSDLAKSIAEELKSSQPDRQAEFSIESNLIVKGDATLLRVALNNLLENAWKYTGKCSQTRIEFGATRQSGETVYFIRDNGIGSDMKYRDKLFQPFQRLHSSDEFPGTGIGLATVQRVIRRHGGRIWAESEVGKGATVFFTLGR